MHEQDIIDRVSPLAGVGPNDIDFVGSTTLEPIAMLVALVLTAAAFLVPRRHALLMLVICACVIAPAQRVVLAGFDFTFLRIICGMLVVRILIRGEHRGLKAGPVDVAVGAWAVVTAVAFSVLHGTSIAMVNRLGFLYDVLLVHFVVRALIRDWEDVRSFARGVAVVALPVMCVMLHEQSTGRNLFSLFGGVPEYTRVRLGRLRCQGAFSHPILAGTFWMVMLPVMCSLLRGSARDRLLGLAGGAAAVVIAWTTASSTPIIALLVVLGGLGLFAVARWARYLAYGTIGMLGLLHLAMQAPVWHLLARIPGVPGSTGWYRYLIINEFVEHFGDWWLIGSRDPSGWFQWGLTDIANQYVANGINGGLLALGLFVAAIVLGFLAIGRAMRRPDAAPIDRWASWCVGIALLTNCAAWFAVAYFGQAAMLLPLVFGLCAAMPTVVARSALVCTVEGRDAEGRPWVRRTLALPGPASGVSGR